MAPALLPILALTPSTKKLNKKQTVLAVVATAPNAACVSLPPYRPSRAVCKVTVTFGAAAEQQQSAREMSRYGVGTTFTVPHFYRLTVQKVWQSAIWSSTSSGRWPFRESRSRCSPQFNDTEDRPKLTDRGMCELTLSMKPGPSKYAQPAYCEAF